MWTFEMAQKKDKNAVIVCFLSLYNGSIFVFAFLKLFDTNFSLTAPQWSKDRVEIKSGGPIFRKRVAETLVSVKISLIYMNMLN